MHQHLKNCEEYQHILGIFHLPESCEDEETANLNDGSERDQKEVEDHSNDEVIEGDAELNNPEARHRDALLDAYCDTHPGSPECKVFDE